MVNNKIQQLRVEMCRTEYPAEEEKQPIQHLQENTTLRGDKTLRVKQAFCMVNNKIQQLRVEMCRTEYPAE